MRHAALVLLLSAAAGLGQPPALDIPPEVKPVQGYCKILPKTDAVSVTYVSLGKVYPIPSDVLKDGRMFLLPAAGLANGRYDFVAVAASKTGEQATAQFTVVVGDAPPVPPVPPGPNPPVPPGPVPPTPDPTAPFAGVSGLHVLIVFESADLAKMPPAQQEVLYGQANRTFLDSLTPVGPDGKTHEWRMWDADVSASAEAKHWQEAMKLPRASTPWLYVGNGKAGASVPLPANVADFQALVNRFKP